MAFSSSVSYKTQFGNKRVHYGTWTGASVATGNVNTGLRLCETIMLTINNSAVTSNPAVVDESMPVAGSAVTIVFDSSMNGNWLAVGY